MRFPKKHNVAYDIFENKRIRTAIYLSEKAAIIAAGHLKRKWDTVTRSGDVVVASRLKSKDSE